MIGAKQVELVKAANNHRRFTFTPLISADGNIEKIHILFGNLKKIPKNLNTEVLMDVNKTGMWSKVLLEKYINNYLLKRVNTKSKGQMTLLLIDSFSGHLGLDNKYKKDNLLIRYIPPGMTGVLQVLDVFCNRGFSNSMGINTMLG